MKEPRTSVWVRLRETNKCVVKHLRAGNTGNSTPKPERGRGGSGYQKLRT